MKLQIEVYFFFLFFRFGLLSVYFFTRYVYFYVAYCSVKRGFVEYTLPLA